MMPSLFVGHGSPMNLVEENPFTKAMGELGQNLNPSAILVVSAHWLESQSILQNSTEQKTIHDFYGFPKELYDFSYPSPGWHQELVIEFKDLEIEGVQFTEERGLDHGAWAVLHFMYPEANIPVVQLSIPTALSLPEYFKIGQKLKDLREKNVLILGSGNIVHNLRKIDWNMEAAPVDWAVEFDQIIADIVESKNFEKFLSIDSDHKELFKLSHPTTEHFIPLVYVVGAARSGDVVSFPCSFIQNASISMRSVIFS